MQKPDLAQRTQPGAAAQSPWSAHGGPRVLGRQAAAALLQKLPPALAPSGAVGAFPCFTRGVNQYGAEHVEPDELSAALPGVRLYGMFAHGELGPSRFSGFDSAAPAGGVPSEQHSMTSILALHTHSQADEKDEL